MNDEFDFEAYQASIHRAGRTMLSIGVFLLLAPHIAGWLNTKAAEISGCFFGFIMA